MADLTGKGALVTGGSRGIGAAIVRRLAADGAAVAFTYAENKQAADAVAEKSGALAIQADQADLARIGEVFRLAAEHAGGLDILVNNAGISPPTPILEATEETYDRLMAVNAKGPFFAIQEAGRCCSQPRSRRSAGWANRPTSPTWCRSWPDRTPAGSPARTSASPAGC